MRYDGLAREIRGLSLPDDAAGLTELLALRDEFDARCVAAVAAFDAEEKWDAAGEGSMTAWLKAHAHMSNRTAGRESRVATTMRSLPVVERAWRDGALSSGQVETILGYLHGDLLDLFAEQESAVVPRLVGLTAGETAEEMRRWKEEVDAARATPEPADPSGSLRIVRKPGDRRVLEANMDNDSAALVETALRVALRKDFDDEAPRSWGQRWLDALVDVCKHFLDNQSGRGGGSHRPHLNVITTHDDLAAGRGGRYADGTLVDGITLSVLACDCAVHRVLVHAKDAKIDFGRETRTINADVRTILVVRDGGCRFPGCDRPATFCDGHHVHWWRNGGVTRPENLVLLCRRHHRTLHKPGWRARLDGDGGFHVTDPLGCTRSTYARPLVRPMRAAG